MQETGGQLGEGYNYAFAFKLKKKIKFFSEQIIEIIVVKCPILKYACEIISLLLVMHGCIHLIVRRTDITVRGSPLLTPLIKQPPPTHQSVV